MSNSSGPYDPYGNSSDQPGPYGDSGASPYPHGGGDSYGGGTPSPYADQGPYTSPAPAAPPSGGGYADPYAGGAPGHQASGGYGAPGSYGPPASYGGGYYPPVAGYQNSAGGWSLGLGIAAVVLCVVPLLSQGIAIAAIVTGVLGRKAVSEGRANNGGMALAGIIIGATLLVLSIIATIFWVGRWAEF